MLPKAHWQYQFLLELHLTKMEKKKIYIFLDDVADERDHSSPSGSVLHVNSKVLYM